METDQRPKILVAEDDESNFLLLLAILKQDYRVVHARDGAETVEMYKSMSPDAILMDVCMPHVDGLYATREIRKMDGQLPIIAVSAHVFDQDKIEAHAAGCDAYITKPINFQLLRMTLAKLLVERERRQA